jgi:hypothetical protein
VIEELVHKERVAIRHVQRRLALKELRSDDDVDACTEGSVSSDRLQALSILI